MRLRFAQCSVAAVAATVACALLGAPTAHAHPLGNFSINRAHNLMFQPGSIVDRAIVDFAEIPTAQDHGQMDRDGDGQISASEFAERGRRDCEDMLGNLTLTVDSEIAPFTVTDSSFSYQPGQAGLPTGRLECRLEAVVDLSVPRQVDFDDESAIDRVGWHEITARGDGVRLVGSPVPESSSTGELRSYPVDLLDSPLDVRRVTVATSPAATASDDATIVTGDADRATSSPDESLVNGGPLAGVVDRVTDRFNELVGRRDLTFGIGLLAVALATILGASHALLPGHGKTVMAAYIAGRQGSSRDAVVVGATVTATHTGGVLMLGLALTLSSSLAGESVLQWLGLISGLMIAALGASLLVGAIRHRVPAHGHHHSFGRHDNFHDHVHDHDHDHDHVHGHGHGHGSHGAAVATLVRPGTANRTTTIAKRRSSRDMGTSDIAPRAEVVSRRGLIGMGIAGGLVPSPSALIVLLSAIALGRTAFGVILVIGYGVGMATTLTLAGLLLVRIRDRYQRSEAGTGRAAAVAARWTACSPYATALLVVVVGVGIAARALTAI